MHIYDIYFISVSQKTSSKDFVEIEISKLISDSVSITVYGKEEPYMELVSSIQEKGLLDLIVVDDTYDN